MSRRKRNKERNQNKHIKVQEQKFGSVIVLPQQTEEKKPISFTKKPKAKFIPKPPCHIGFTEILPHLFVGKEGDLTKEFVSKIDVLVPLNDLRGKIWDMGYRNDIMYLPVSDYDVLPIDVEKHYVKKISDLVKDGKNVAIFCLGGHGRTGYIASLVMHEMEVVDPIGLLRSNYCEKAVESSNQVDAIATYCEDYTLMDKYRASTLSWADFADIIDYGGWGGYNNYNYGKVVTYQATADEETAEEYYNKAIGKETCGNCAENWHDVCCLTGEEVFDCKGACVDFILMA